jgi:hypothetical protein
MTMSAVATGGSLDDGAAFSAAVSKDGILHTWGAGGDFYLMGNGRHQTEAELAVPTKVFTLKCVVLFTVQNT